MVRFIYSASEIDDWSETRSFLKELGDINPLYDEEFIDDPRLDILTKAMGDCAAKYKVSLEPSVQGLDGLMELYKERNGKSYYLASTDYRNFCDRVVNRAIASKDEGAFKRKFTFMLRQICDSEGVKLSGKAPRQHSVEETIDIIVPVLKLINDKYDEKPGVTYPQVLKEAIRTVKRECPELEYGIDYTKADLLRFLMFHTDYDDGIVLPDDYSTDDLGYGERLGRSELFDDKYGYKG